MDEKPKNKYLPFVLNFTSLIKRAALYSPAHPVIVTSLHEVYGQLAEAVVSDSLHLTVTDDRKIFANGEQLEISDTIVASILPYLQKWRIEEISFKSGILEQELHAFLGILLWNDAMVASTGDVSRALERQSISHIELNLFSYKKVRKDEDVGQKAPEQMPVPKKEKTPTQLLKDKLRELFRKKPEDVLKNMESVRSDLCTIVSVEVKEHKKVSASTRALLEKYVLQSQDMETFLVKLQEKLVEAGVSPQESEKIIKSLRRTFEQVLAPKPSDSSDTTARPPVTIQSLQDENRRLKDEIRSLRSEVEAKQKVIDELSKPSL